MSEFTSPEKDSTETIIIVSGVVVGILIIIGGIVSLVSVLSWHPGDASVPSQTSGVSLTSTFVPVANTNPPGASSSAFTLSDNQSSQTISYPTVFTLELPASLYPRANLLLFGNPANSIVLVRDTTPTQTGDWAVELQTATTGVADIIVGAAQTSTSDYHVSLTIQ